MNANFDITKTVIYRDNLIIALNKPAGIPVHPGPRREGESLEDYFDQLCFDYHHPPHLAHRLDRDTSGCLILGRNKKGLRKMGHLFETRQVKKTYWAIVHGGPKDDEGTIDGWLEKIKTSKGWYMKTCGEKDGAQNAVTAWKVLERHENTTWLELYPQTGRTHQIRVHCQSLGCPIVGDWVYGNEQDTPLLLHARSIEMPLHHDEPALRVEAEVPENWPKNVPSPSGRGLG
ncbi:MAG: RNA pseudouridine synthase [Alphaproteobacteria bacterium]|nr:RNA pseudouridine synthase [Alphaproteobacteria bacterium]